MMAKIPWIGGTLLLISLIIAYTRELPIMMNYLNVDAFWRTGLLIGLAVSLTGIGILFAAAKVKSLPVVEKLQLGSTVFFLSLLLCPLFLSWANRVGISSEQAVPTTVILESEQARYTSRFGSPKGTSQQANQFILFFFQNGQLRRVNGKQPFFPGKQSGDTIVLEIIEGRCGFEWVAQ